MKQCAALLFVVFSLAVLAAQPPSKTQGRPAFVPPDRYDDGRDPQADLELARWEAGKTGKRVLVIVGGEWCAWCHSLDTFIAEHPDLKRVLDSGFVTLKVAVSPEGKARADFLAQFPPVETFPYFLIIDQKGLMLKAQDSASFEKAPYYNDAKLVAFFTEWSLPGPRKPSK